jgi:hypothetical protein
MNRRPALILLFLITLPAVTPRLYASDEIQYFAFLRSLWFDRDVSFDNEYRYFDARGVAARSGFRETYLDQTTPTGLRPSVATIGCALLWAPFYAVGHLVARASGALGYAVDADGYSTPYIAAVCFGSAVYGMAALVLSIAILERMAARAIPAAMLVWFGTPLFFYMYISPVMAHACSAFAVTLFLWTWLRVRTRWTPGGVALLGALGALVTMVREQDVFFLAGPALDFVRHAIQDQPAALGARQSSTDPNEPGAKRQAPIRVAVAVSIGVLSFALIYLPQALAYLTLNGRLGPSAVTTRKMTWTSPHALGVLFSPEHGFVFWTPLVLLALAGLLLLRFNSAYGGALPPGDRRWIASLLLLMAALQVYVAGSVESWTVAGAFGQRRFVSLTPLLVIGLAALLDTTRRQPVARGAVAAAATLCLWWNIGLMVQFGAHLMDRQRLTLRHNAWTTFVTLPREAPGLAWRYFTDRASFYSRPPQ